MKKLSKTMLAAIIIVIVTAAAFGVGLYLLLRDNEPYRDLFENSQLKIKVNGEELGIYTAEELAELSGIKEFSAVYKPSGKDPILRGYEGFELKSVLAAAGIDISQIKSVSFRGLDGFTKGLFPLSDLHKDKEIFIAVKYAGKNFIRGVKPSCSAYPEEDGGPFVVIKASDAFSNNRIRGLAEINVTV